MSLSREQMELRRTGVTASEVAAVAGLNPFRTPIQAWAQKLELEEPEPENEAMARGNYLEPALLRWAGDVTGLVVGPGGTIVRDDMDPHVIATPDGYGYEAGVLTEPPSHVLEVKAPQTTAADWTDPAVDPLGAPLYYLAQVQWQLLAARMDRAILAALIHGKLWVYHVDAHPALQAQLLAMARVWWRHVVARTPPPVSDPADARALQRSIRQTSDEIVRIEGPQAAEVAAMLRDFQQAQARAKAAMDEQDGIKARILHLVGERAGLDAGDMSCTWKAAKASQVTDWQKVSEAAGATEEDIARHTIERPGSRRLYVKARKAG
jgi:putative phage-type endonuclease